MDSKNNKIILVAVVLILVAGFSGYYMGMQKVKIVEIELARYQKALEIFVPPMPDEILSVSGTVREAGSDFLVIDVPSLSHRVLPGEVPLALEARRVSVSSDTTIVKINPMRPPTPEEMQKGIFNTETKIKLSDIKAGDSITAEASENIKTKLDFVAKKIIFIVRELPSAGGLPMMPPPLPPASR